MVELDFFAGVEDDLLELLALVDLLDVFRVEVDLLETLMDEEDLLDDDLLMAAAATELELETAEVLALATVEVLSLADTADEAIFDEVTEELTLAVDEEDLLEAEEEEALLEADEMATAEELLDELPATEDDAMVAELDWAPMLMPEGAEPDPMD